jgi:tetratricopeptide (TPR) repeat protein
MPDPVRPTGPDAEAASRPAQPAAKRQQASIFADPIVRVMAWAAAGLLTLYLVVVVSALLTGVLTSPAPRTASERSLDAAQSAVKAGDHSAKALADYANALIEVQQFGAAQDVISTAPKTALGTPTADVEVAQARLYLAEKDYAKSQSEADTAMKIIKTAFDAQVAKAGLNVAKTQGISNNYYDALLIKGAAAAAAGDPRGAIKAFDAYLEHDGFASDVLVQRAQAKLKIKDVAGAKADFQAALKYTPDYQSAIDGLKTIGAGQ